MGCAEGADLGTIAGVVRVGRGVAVVEGLKIVTEGGGAAWVLGEGEGVDVHGPAWAIGHEDRHVPGACGVGDGIKLGFVGCTGSWAAVAAVERGLAEVARADA